MFYNKCCTDAGCLKLPQWHRAAAPGSLWSQSFLCVAPGPGSFRNPHGDMQVAAEGGALSQEGVWMQQHKYISAKEPESYIKYIILIHTDQTGLSIKEAASNLLFSAGWANFCKSLPYSASLIDMWDTFVVSFKIICVLSWHFLMYTSNSMQGDFPAATPGGDSSTKLLIELNVFIFRKIHHIVFGHKRLKHLSCSEN